MKWCSKCERMLPADSDYFAVKRDHSDGLASHCKPCLVKEEQKRYAAKRDKILAQQSAYRLDNIEKFRDRDHAYYMAHRDERLAYQAAYVDERRDQVSAYQRDYRSSHLPQFAAYGRLRKARKLGNGGTHTAADIRAQDDRQGHTCFWCRDKLNGKYHVDHVVPLNDGGGNGPENLVLACPKCNLSKGAKHPMEFAGVMF